MKELDADRFARIERDTSMGYAVTMKDLVWLVRLVRKLQPPAVSPQPQPSQPSGKVAAPAKPKTPMATTGKVDAVALAVHKRFRSRLKAKS